MREGGKLQSFKSDTPKRPTSRNVEGERDKKWHADTAEEVVIHTYGTFFVMFKVQLLFNKGWTHFLSSLCLFFLSLISQYVSYCGLYTEVLLYHEIFNTVTSQLVHHEALRVSHTVPCSSQSSGWTHVATAQDWKQEHRSNSNSSVHLLEPSCCFFFFLSTDHEC